MAVLLSNRKGIGATSAHTHTHTHTPPREKIEVEETALHFYVYLVHASPLRVGIALHCVAYCASVCPVAEKGNAMTAHARGQKKKGGTRNKKGKEPDPELHKPSSG